MPELIHLEPQPDFPIGDLTPNNSNVLPFILETEAGIVTRRAANNPNYHLFDIVHNALIKNDRDSEKNPDTLKALMDGFYAFETMTDLVRGPHLYDIQTAAAQAGRFLTLRSGISENELGRSRESFRTLSPRAFRIIANLGDRSLAMTNIRTMGAATARQLQLPVAI